jgi:HEAT repeat protein
MNDARFQGEDELAGRSGLPAGGDLLPPVEPPSAGFIIQLFVVPALIVLAIVAVWLTVSSLMRTATDPKTLIEGLEHGPSVARWQRASELADMLRNERFVEFRRSPEAAEDLARILEREIDGASSTGGMDEGAIALRAFIARALGEFEVNDGIKALLKAADTSRDPAEQLVRYRALEAIAVRAYSLPRLDPPQSLSHSELEPTLFRLAGDDDPLIRRRTAFALGQLGTAAAVERLEVMVDDPDADTRYNAAVALAHRGNSSSAETLAEMLDPDELAGIRDESDEHSRELKRAVIVGNALKAAEELARRNSQADFSLIVEALERLTKADSETLAKAQLPPRVAFDAKRVLDQLPRTRAKSGAP